MNAEIIAIGSEMLTPFRQDTNSLYLTSKLNELGVEVSFKCVVGDHAGHITRAASLALSRADIVILIGGLGPTEDDLTREAAAAALGVEVRRDSEVLELLAQRFAARNLKMAANNAKQADVLAGATVLPNPNGSAPGQWIAGKCDGKERIIILLPGPPHELKPLFEQECMERLRSRLPEQHIAVREIKVALMSESHCDALVAPIYQRYTDVQSTILAGAGEIQLHLKTRAASQAAAQARIDQLTAEIEEKLGDAVFSDNGDSLEQIVGYYLQM
ncbi:MAG TPA: molybdopterin-binding protein, partial [Terriglobales bacterium]